MGGALPGIWGFTKHGGGVFLREGLTCPPGASPAHRWLYREVGDILVLKYLSWTMYPTALAAFSTGFSQSITPHSGGSPTRGGTVRRAQLVTFLQSHKHPQAPPGEKLAAAGTLGDNCAIEPVMLQFSPWTSLHQEGTQQGGFVPTRPRRHLPKAHHLFELLKLQRIFVTRFGELVGAVTFLRSYLENGIYLRLCSESIAAIYKSDLRIDFPFDLLETFFFAVLGAVCGLLGCAYLFCQRWLLAAVRENRLTAKLLATESAIGRLLGETVAWLFPRGLRSEGDLRPVIPGGYALAGAAAFSGSVTHAISTLLLVCEATGHLSHVLPVVLAVLVANAITQKHQPSFYDGTIIVKKLPYLPPIRSRHMASYQVVVEEFMEHRVVALAKGDGFEEVLVALDASADAEYPVVEGTGSPTLVGTVRRAQLVTFLPGNVEFYPVPRASNANATEAASSPSTSPSPWELGGDGWGEQGDTKRAPQRDGMGIATKGTAWG
nr:PREDICTED: chloride channel protein ClC-Kb-like [Opisthocomus hoazin]